jgi:hypothetical protein
VIDVVYWPLLANEDKGVALKTGAVMGILAIFILAAVAGKMAVITPESALWVTDVAPATVKKLAVTPVSV